jgi:predicted kinase
MQGLPGSGKSTMAKMIADKVEGIIFSTDDFWYQGGNGLYDFDVDKLRQAHLWNQRRTIKEMQAEDSADIIIDNTNITRKEALPYIVMAGIYEYEVQVVRVQVDVETCIARQQNRSIDRRIPEEVIRKKAEDMENLL